MQKTTTASFILAMTLIVHAQFLWSRQVKVNHMAQESKINYNILQTDSFCNKK